MMQNFEFYKTIRLSNKKEVIKKAFSMLNDIYTSIPETRGCLECIRAEKGCCSWCCRIQTPQLFYSEFLLIWDHVSREFDNDQMLDLFEKCMLNAVTNTPSKGCVFFDEKTNLCKIHTVRPYNCRLYGITPEEEFRPRYERLKEEYKNIKDAVIKDQCNLIQTADGSIVTVKKTKAWFLRVKKVDVLLLGIPRQMATDDLGGSYRSPHDHILLYNMPTNILNALAGIKLYKTHQEKIDAVRQLVLCMKDFFRSK